MFNFGQGQGRREFQPQEYTQYFEDWNLSLALRLGKRGRFAKVSVYERRFPSSQPLDHSREKGGETIKH
jgi:hypothetical protein